MSARFVDRDGVLRDQDDRAFDTNWLTSANVAAGDVFYGSRECAPFVRVVIEWLETAYKIRPVEVGISAKNKNDNRGYGSVGFSLSARLERVGPLQKAKSFLAELSHSKWTLKGLGFHHTATHLPYSVTEGKIVDPVTSNAFQAALLKDHALYAYQDRAPDRVAYTFRPLELSGLHEGEVELTGRWECRYLAALTKIYEMEANPERGQYTEFEDALGRISAVALCVLTDNFKVCLKELPEL